MKQFVSNFTIVDSILNNSDHLPIMSCINVPVDVSTVASRHKTSVIRDFRWDKGNIIGFLQ